MFQKSSWRARKVANFATLANLANLITKSLSLKFSKVNLLNQLRIKAFQTLTPTVRQMGGDMLTFPVREKCQSHGVLSSFFCQHQGGESR